MKLLRVVLLMTVLVFIYIEIRFGMLWSTGGLDYYLNSSFYKKAEIVLLVTIILQLALLILTKRKIIKRK